jgi:serine/threonine protein kinase
MNRPGLTPKEVFDEAFEIADPEEREAFLEQVCGHTPELRERVAALLQAHDRAGSFLETPADSQPETSPYEPESVVTGEAPRPQPEPERELPEGEIGTQIGPYKLVEKIGQGGMGSVYLAEQEHPVRRQVALKLIKRGLDSSQVIARFETERQALALMDHPNIARVLDAGYVGQVSNLPARRQVENLPHSGRPYFVMELVKGQPITKYCDEHRLTPRQRLELFLPICQAIQHAHQKGIIHRDIKPSNVLVTTYDGRPVPKVIDFGIAKAIEQPLVEPEMATQLGTIVGTFEYMSPEQADIGSLDVDTRSDVYSLGAMLYEMLTGSTPLERTLLRKAALSDMLRMIKEEEPLRPGARFLASQDRLAAIAAQRSTEPSRLAKTLDGDIGWIVLKALQKDRRQRYDTAIGFARDLQHYLADEPVEARPPSVTYLVRKFARRHRALLATVGGFVALLLLGVVALTLGILAVNRAHADTQKALDSEQRAQKQTRQSLLLNDAVIDAMIRNRTHLGDSEKGVLREVLKQYESLALDVSDTAEARSTAAETQGRKGNHYLLLGDYPHADASYAAAIRMLQELHVEYPEVSAHRVELAKQHFNRGISLHSNGKLPEAAVAYRQAAEMHEGLSDEFQDKHTHRRDLADDYNNLGAVLSDQEKFTEAEQAYRKAIAISEELVARQPQDSDYAARLGATCSNLGNALRDQGQVKVSLDWYARAIAMLEPIAAQGEPGASAQLFLRNAHWDRANALGQLFRHDEAVGHWERAINLDDGKDRDRLRAFLETSRAAVVLQDKIRAGRLTTADVFDGALTYSRGARAASAVDPRLGEQYATMAVKLLEQARLAGFFNDPSRLGKLNHADLHVLRERPDFKKFTAALPSGPGK